MGGATRQVLLEKKNDNYGIANIHWHHHPMGPVIKAGARERQRFY